MGSGGRQSELGERRGWDAGAAIVHVAHETAVAATIEAYIELSGLGDKGMRRHTGVRARITGEVTVAATPDAARDPIVGYTKRDALVRRLFPT